MKQKLSTQQALIYVMVVSAVADRKVKDRELLIINKALKTLPIFYDYLSSDLDGDIANCLAMLSDEDGIHSILQLLAQSLAEKYYATAYALACEVMAADDKIAQEEMRWLELLKHHFHLDKLHVAALEYSTRVRFIHD